MTTMICKTGEYWEPEQEQIISWQQSYPDVDVYQELNAMGEWLQANPTRRKTLRGMPRFCNSWLNRAQEKNGSPAVKAKQAERESRGVKATRDMTNEEMFSRDWFYDRGEAL